MLHQQMLDHKYKITSLIIIAQLRISSLCSQLHLINDAVTTELSPLTNDS